MMRTLRSVIARTARQSAGQAGRIAISTWCCVALATSSCIGSEAATVEDEPTARDETLLVSSDPSSGTLARIDYDDGSSVMFMLEEDGGISIAWQFATGSRNPLAGIDAAQLSPSEVFIALTKQEAPLALREAERTAGLSSERQVQRDVARPRALGRSESALTAEEFRARCSAEGVTQCETDVTGDLILKSPGTPASAFARVDVQEGSVRIRVQRDRVIGGWDTRGATETMRAGESRCVIRHLVALAGRPMRLNVDQADSARYHASVEFFPPNKVVLFHPCFAER